MQYSVAYLDRKNRVSQSQKRISLARVLAIPDIKERYPHTVKHYRESSGKGQRFSPVYLETRVVEGVDDLLGFLKHLNI